MSADSATASAVEIAARVRDGEWSPVDVTDSLLARIADWEPRLNAFVDLDVDGARRQAREAADAVARGDELGALHGVPVTVKNIQAVAGFPTHRGSRLSDRTPAPEDAPLVARMRAAGAIIVGTTTLPEQGWTAVGDSPLTGSTHNPWRHGLTSGGSSAGAGALAGAGCGPLHVGTDGAGSIRIPAAFCGAVGFKPTYGTVPYVPVPNNGSLSHAGPITRTVADAALMLSVMGGPDPRDHTSLPTTPRSTVEPGGLRGLRIAYSPDLGHARVDPDVAGEVERSLAALTDAGALVELVTPEWGPSGPAMERDLWSLAVLAYLPPDEATAEQMDPGLVACTREYADFTTAQAIDAQRRRIAYAREVNSWFGDSGWDLLVTPSTSVTALGVGRQQPEHWPQHPWDWLSWAEFSYPFNLSHGPAISVPCGLTAGGLPVGLQLAGPRLADDLVLRAAAAFLDQQPFDRLPTLT
jgi:aspartyl-tRNA(Asn)/glutamyl-tRNA(Gln) amidotransferase subunit A